MKPARKEHLIVGARFREDGTLDTSRAARMEVPAGTNSRISQKMWADRRREADRVRELLDVRKYKPGTLEKVEHVLYAAMHRVEEEYNRGGKKSNALARSIFKYRDALRIIRQFYTSEYAQDAVILESANGTSRYTTHLRAAFGALDRYLDDLLDDEELADKTRVDAIREVRQKIRVEMEGS